MRWCRLLLVAASTSFANPAITVGRMFSDSFAGIAPSSVPVFIAAQIAGGVAGVIIIKVLYPALTSAQAAQAVMPHEAAEDRAVPGPDAARLAGMPDGDHRLLDNGR